METIKTIELNQNLKIYNPFTCNVCGTEYSIHYEHKEIMINDKHGTCKDLTFNYCEECGDVTNVNFL